MASIICYRCFAEFPPAQLHFKCSLHKVDDPKLGAGSPLVFPWRARGWRQTPPPHTFCPRCELKTGFRVCPHCHQDLPYYVGRLRQQIVAVTGCSGSGKTVYISTLLHQLREKLTTDPDPFAVAMFEDDASFRLYQKDAITLWHNRELMEKTQGVDQRQGDLPPVIVRLMRRGSSGHAVCNLIFYDPAGELIESLEDVKYLRYLAHSAAIIYLVDSPREDDPAANDELASRASDGLGSIAGQIRRELQLAPAQPIPMALAVAVAKADSSLFPKYGEKELVPGSGRGQEFWRRWRRSSRTEVERVSTRCERVLRELGYNDLVAKARLNFRTVRYFALSSLGQQPDGEQLERAPEPIGVEAPLFWILRSLG